MPGVLVESNLAFGCAGFIFIYNPLGSISLTVPNLPDETHPAFCPTEIFLMLAFESDQLSVTNASCDLKAGALTWFVRLNDIFVYFFIVLAFLVLVLLVVVLHLVAADRGAIV